MKVTISDSHLLYFLAQLSSCKVYYSELLIISKYYSY